MDGQRSKDNFLIISRKRATLAAGLKGAVF